MATEERGQVEVAVDSVFTISEELIPDQPVVRFGEDHRTAVGDRSGQTRIAGVESRSNVPQSIAEPIEPLDTRAVRPFQPTGVLRLRALIDDDRVVRFGFAEIAMPRQRAVI